MEQETLMLFCVIIKKVPQSCKISRDSCLMILNHFLWFYCNPEPLYFSQILFQTIRHWSKVSLLLIFFRYPTYSGGDLVAKSYLTLASPWTVGCQAPLPMGFSRQEYWSGLPFPSPGDLPEPGIEPRSPTLQADALTSVPPGKPSLYKGNLNCKREFKL